MNQQSMCVVKDRDAELPPAVVEVWDQNQIQYGLTDSVLSDHSSKIEFGSKLGFKGNLDTVSGNL